MAGALPIVRSNQPIALPSNPPLKVSGAARYESLAVDKNSV